MSYFQLFEDLWEDPALQLTLAYCESRKPYQGSKFLYGGEIVGLKPNEVLLDVNDSSKKLKLSEQELLEQLKKLQDLERLTYRLHGKHYVIAFCYQFMPVQVATHNEEPNDGEIAPITFNEFKLELLEHKKLNNKEKTVENDERVLTHFAKKYGNLVLHKLTLGHLKDFLEDRKIEKPDLSQTTLRMDAKTLKAALERAVEWGHIKENPFRDFRLPKEARKRTPSFTEEEYGAFSQTIRSENLRRVFDFAYLTGFRRNEILYLQWKQIKFEDECIQIVEHEGFSPKGGRERFFPISDYIFSFLKKIPQVSEYVFVDENERPYKPNYVTKVFKKYVREGGFDDKLKFHSLRATNLSILARNGTHITVIRDLAGHCRTNVTENYITTPSNDLRAAVEKIRLPNAKDSEEKEGKDKK